MATISAPVGKGGVNHPSDVKTIQKLLNEHSLPPLRSLEIDGIAGPATINAIEHFQSVKVGMKSPDGRVDPGGKTFRKLRDVPSGPETTPGSDSLPPEQRRVSQKERRKFVRGPVKELPVTTRIIDAIQPHFRGVRATVISGYLNDSDLFWKVNYHWEYLLWMAEHALTLKMSVNNKKKMQALRSSLIASKPDPDSGYRTSATVGKPEDRSSAEEANKRYQTLRQGKRVFKQITQAEELKDKSQRGDRAFDLAAAPVARPAMSKHKTGYALDIEGNNPRIKSISKNLGGTLTFDEKSHVHVEFAKGVQRSA